MPRVERAERLRIFDVQFADISSRNCHGALLEPGASRAAALVLISAAFINRNLTSAPAFHRPSRLGFRAQLTATAVNGVPILPISARRFKCRLTLTSKICSDLGGCSPRQLISELTCVAGSHPSSAFSVPDWRSASLARRLHGAWKHHVRGKRSWP